jgi:2-polyprenyl-3-methyl-5-hydroxy-6-metoxy-1,4-benzoquinol methylase
MLSVTQNVVEVALGENYLKEEKVLLSNRFRYNDNSYFPLSELQQQARLRIIENINHGNYTFQSLPSLCGSTDDVVLSHTDRYGIPTRIVISRVSGFIRVDPYFDNETVSRFYKYDYRDLYSSNLGVIDYFEKQVLRGEYIYQFLHNSGLLEGKHTVFEIGCGSGGILFALQQKGYQCLGCDYGPEYIAYGKEKGLDLYEGGVDDYSGEKEADIVIISHVLEHIVDPIAFLKSIKKILSKQGLLFIAVPGILYNHSSHRNLLSLFCQAHVHYFTLSSLDYVCANAGFRRIKSDESIQAIYQLDEHIIPEIDETHFSMVYQSLRKIVSETEKEKSAYQSPLVRGKNFIRKLLRSR